jgi:hypothetical protein
MNCLSRKSKGLYVAMPRKLLCSKATAQKSQAEHSDADNYRKLHTTGIPGWFSSRRNNS